MLRILAVDGGGVRGLIPATVLRALETASGGAIYELFDCIAGTSTGSLVASVLTAPGPDGRPRGAEFLQHLYAVDGGHIFPHGGEGLLERLRADAVDGTTEPARFRATGREALRRLSVLTAPFGGGEEGARYSAKPLEHELGEIFGDTMMSQALRPLVIVSCDFDTGEPVLFRGGGLDAGVVGDIPMREAVRASSAGPTFFTPITITGSDGVKRTCVDGGLVANDPALVAYSEALTVHPDTAADDVIVVSLGTGRVPGTPAETNDAGQHLLGGTWAGLAGPALHAMVSGPAELARRHLQCVLGDRYVRLDIELGFGATHAMDDVRPENVAALQQNADALVAASQSTITALAARLRP